MSPQSQDISEKARDPDIAGAETAMKRAARRARQQARISATQDRPRSSSGKETTIELPNDTLLEFKRMTRSCGALVSARTMMLTATRMLDEARENETNLRGIKAPMFLRFSKYAEPVGIPAHEQWRSLMCLSGYFLGMSIEQYLKCVWLMQLEDAPRSHRLFRLCQQMQTQHPKQYSKLNSAYRRWGQRDLPKIQGRENIPARTINVSELSAWCQALDRHEWWKLRYAYEDMSGSQFFTAEPIFLELAGEFELALAAIYPKPAKA